MNKEARYPERVEAMVSKIMKASVRRVAEERFGGNEAEVVRKALASYLRKAESRNARDGR